ILGAYRAVPPGVLPWVAAVLIAAELLAGVWLLARPRSPALTPVWVYTAVAVAWAALGGQAYARGLAVGNRGWFGVCLAQRLTLVHPGPGRAAAGLRRDHDPCRSARPARPIRVGGGEFGRVEVHTHIATTGQPGPQRGVSAAEVEYGGVGRHGGG